MRVAARVTWLLTGLVWAARSLIGLAHPAYRDPVTTLDHVAVWSFSLGWILLAASVLFIGRLAPTREVLIVSAIVAAGAVAAGIANGIEDGFGQRAWGTVYVIGSLTGFIGLLALVTVIARAGVPRLALAVAGMLLGLSLSGTENVLAVAAAVTLLLVFGALAATPDWFGSGQAATAPT